jgi:hypothetical protein
MEDSMKPQTIIFGIAMVLAVSSYAADMTLNGKLKGIVTDSAGAVIPSAAVLIHRDWPQGDTQDLRLTTDKAGEFSLDLTPGFYDVAIFAHGFSPNAGKVRIRTSKVTNYTVPLPPDPQMLSEFGDSFVENPEPAKPSPKR